MKKALIVYYSRTGVTKRLAESLHHAMDSDIEELVDTKDRSGTIWYLLAGKEATLKKLTTIKTPKFDPADYDILLIWTPVRAFTMASAVRTYITDHHKNFPKKIAFFCTQSWSGHERTFRHMAELSQKKPAATADFLTKDIVHHDFQKRMWSSLFPRYCNYLFIYNDKWLVSYTKSFFCIFYIKFAMSYIIICFQWRWYLTN